MTMELISSRFWSSHQRLGARIIGHVCFGEEEVDDPTRVGLWWVHPYAYEQVLTVRCSRPSSRHSPRVNFDLRSRALRHQEQVCRRVVEGHKCIGVYIERHAIEHQTKSITTPLNSPHLLPYLGTFVLSKRGMKVRLRQYY
jgi:hypothetical protein